MRKFADTFVETVAFVKEVLKSGNVDIKSVKEGATEYLLKMSLVEVQTKARPSVLKLFEFCMQD